MYTPELLNIVIRRKTDPDGVIAENRLFGGVLGNQSIHGSLQQIFGNDHFDLDFVGSKDAAGIAESSGHHTLTATGSFPGTVGVMTKAAGTGIQHSVADSGSLSGGYIEIQTVILLHKNLQTVEFTNKVTQKNAYTR